MSIFALCSALNQSCSKQNITLFEFYRSRVCRIPERSSQISDKEEDNKPCPGPSTVMLFCNLQGCPVAMEWTPWTSWSECSRKCGGGTRSRKRICDKKDLLRDDQTPSCDGN